MRLCMRSVALALVVSACGSTSPPPRKAPPPSRSPIETHAPRALLIDDAPAEIHRATAPHAAAPRELVLQGGHVLYIYDAALHPDGSLVAMLSVDMPDLGQEMTPATPYSTVTILEPASGLVRASWRIRTPDLQASGSHVAFSRDGDRLYLVGHEIRAWDLRDASMRALPDDGWTVPDPTADVAIQASMMDRPARARLAPLFGAGSPWTRELGSEAGEPGSIAWHPSGDRVAVLGDELFLFDREGHELARRAVGADGIRFSPSGGAIYADGVALHPRTLEELGETPWSSIGTISDDGAVLFGGSDAGTALFDARTGERIADIEILESSDEMEVSQNAGMAFVPGTHRLWMCWYVTAAASAAPSSLVPPGAEPDAWIDYVHCRGYGETGSILATHDVASPIPFGTGAGPLSLSETGPVLVVTADEQLVIALMHRVLVVSSEGRVLHALDDIGIEAFIDDAIETADGVALATPVALGVLGPSGGDAALCPGLFDAARRLRANGPTLFAQRFACTPGAPMREHDAILGVSRDGRSMVVAEGDVFEAEARVVLVSASGRRVLRGAEAWCQIDGCGPEAVFLPGEARVLLEHTVFDARTGRRIRELDFDPVAFSPSGRMAGAVGEDGSDLVVQDVVTGDFVVPESASPHDGTGPGELAFVDDRRFVVTTSGGVALLEASEARWRRTLAGSVARIVVSGDRAAVIHGEGDATQLTVLRLAEGAPLVSAPVTQPYLDADRAAWCEDGSLRVLELRATEPRTSGPCLGRVLHAGARFAVSADGARARVTRLTDGESVRVRIAIYPGRGAWTITEDDHGHWHTEESGFDRFRVREPGSVLEAPLVALSESAPGYDADLVRRFFAP